DFHVTGVQTCALPISLADAVRLVGLQRELITDYVGVHICSLLFANLFYQLLEGALASWVPERASALMRRLALCPPGNRTLETNEIGRASCRERVWSSL